MQGAEGYKRGSKRPDVVDEIRWGVGKYTAKGQPCCAHDGWGRDPTKLQGAQCRVSGKTVGLGDCGELKSKPWSRLSGSGQLKKCDTRGHYGRGAGMGIIPAQCKL